MQRFTLLLLIFLCSSCLAFIAMANAQETVWDKAYDDETQKRFIPVELFTGSNWDGQHELTLKEVDAKACATVSGKNRPCDTYHVTGPFKTKVNDTKIEWVGNEIPYYRRVFETKNTGQVESFFTINNSKDGLVRIYDKRKQWGARTYDGLGSKFPLGYWKQGEVRIYGSKRPVKIEIIELDGADHCLTFRWVIGQGKKRNQDNTYTFCPKRGFTNIRHNNVSQEMTFQHNAIFSEGIVQGIITEVDSRFGNLRTNIQAKLLAEADIAQGDLVCVRIHKFESEKFDAILPFVEAFNSVSPNKPLVYLNSSSSLSLAVNNANFAKKYNIGSGAQWRIQIRKCT